MKKKKEILDIISVLGVEPTKEIKDVVNLLIKKGTLNETDISEELGMRVNDVRKILYALGKLDAVYYTKDKHPEKKWWYIYSWTLDSNKVYSKYIEFLKKRLRNKEEILADTSISFVCKKCERKMEHSDALACNFRCTHCNHMLKAVKKRVAGKLEREIKNLRKEIEEYS